MANKPKCKLIGVDGNVFILIGIVFDRLACHHKDKKKVAKEFMARALNECANYDQVLRLISTYVEIE